MGHRTQITCILLLPTLALGGSLAAQTAVLPPWADSTVVIVPGPQYAKGGLFRVLAGAHYRDLWATPIRVPLLNLRRFAGGLTPLKAHTGSQTKSLRFAGGDGREYQFRSVDKDPTAHLAPELQVSAVAKLQRDGVSASHPAASVVASALLDAADVLHVSQTLVVMPDDPSLGQYRAQFKGLLGMIEERPDELDEGGGGVTFAGTERIISPARLFERIDASPADRVDADAFLTARLMDIFMGDRDRHRDQWRWASFGTARPTKWEPISRDHDEAFVQLDGPVLAITRLYYPPLVAFRDRYPKLYQLNWHAREVDRRFLVELDRHVWDSVASSLQRTLTDSVIQHAVDRMPPEMAAVDSARLTRVLKHRRDQLTSEALKYYEFLSEEVEVRGTDAPEVAELVRTDPRHVELTLREPNQAAPWFQRRFDAAETKELRVKLWGGNDSVLVRGPGGRTALKVVGGGGDDAFVDSSTAGHVKFYDDSGQTTLVSARHAKLNRRHYREWIGSDVDRYPPREWGTWWRPLAWVAANPDVGAFIGGGFLRTQYGFRRSPYASNVQARAGYATGANTYRADLNAEFHQENRSRYWRLYALASGIEVLRYYGLGNNTEPAGGSSFHRVTHKKYSLEPTLVVPLGPQVQVSVGLAGQYFDTGDNAGRFIATIEDTLYGAGDFGQAGGIIALNADSRDREANPRRGGYLRAAAKLVPAVWDVTSTYGTGEAEAATFLTPPGRGMPTLALRAGGRKIWGDRFPFQESAFLGGRSTIRGFYRERFAGDASLYGNAELRLPVATIYRVLPALWGFFANADAGRVYLDGASPGGWHTSAGGGIWLAWLNRSNTTTIGVAASSERTIFYVGGGFGF